MKLTAALGPLDIDWIEDPVWMDRLADIGALAVSTTAPLAGGLIMAPDGPALGRKLLPDLTGRQAATVRTSRE